MKHLIPLCALALSTPLLAQDEPHTPEQAIEFAPDTDWASISAEDLLVMDLAPDSHGKMRRVIIQLLPPPYSQGWVDNIRKLARDHWWDGTAVYRVKDNWVAQWGDPTEEKAEPEGLQIMHPGDYVIQFGDHDDDAPPPWHPVAQFTDSYADWVQFEAGWPIASAIDEDLAMVSRWAVHCYGSVGVARGIEDAGSGSTLYAAIGHAPRQLDRNIAVVGRVVEGIEYLSSLPRGTDPSGFYESREEDTPILSVRLASELPDAEQPHLEYLDTDSSSFATYTYLKANRNDLFYRVPAGGVDICNVPVPVRRTPKK